LGLKQGERMVSAGSREPDARAEHDERSEEVDVALE
jgi:hypothetical protein